MGECYLQFVRTSTNSGSRAIEKAENSGDRRNAGIGNRRNAGIGKAGDEFGAGVVMLLYTLVLTQENALPF